MDGWNISFLLGPGLFSGAKRHFSFGKKVGETWTNFSHQAVADWLGTVPCTLQKSSAEVVLSLGYREKFHGVFF